MSQENNAELVASLHPPTMLSNRFFVSAGTGGVRLSFGERGVDQVARYHSAVQLSLEDAEQIAKLITDNLATVRAAIAAGTAEGSSSAH